MKQVISVRDLEEMLRSGKDVRVLPEDALLTPSARDFLRDLEGNGASKNSAEKNSPVHTSGRPVTSKSSPAELEAFLKLVPDAPDKNKIQEMITKLKAAANNKK